MPNNSTASTAPMATRTVLPFPAPEPLDMQSTGLADRWKEWEQTWTFYSDAIQLVREEEKRQVSTLMTVICPDARKVYSNFQWEDLKISTKWNPFWSSLEITAVLTN